MGSKTNEWFRNININIIEKDRPNQYKCLMNKSYPILILISFWIRIRKIRV